MLKYIIQLVLVRNNTSLTASDVRLLSDLPADPDSAVRKLRLSGHETIHAVCPNSKCHKIYAPTFKGQSPIAFYPSHCTHKHFASGPECRTRLTRPRIYGKTEIEVPIKCFVSFSFKDFVASLTCRPGFEDMMDNCSSSQDGIMRDISDGCFLLQSFKGLDGASFRSTPLDARYTFSLCLDFFNPFTNKQAGKKVSIGIISVVCLSLPPSYRYRPENMFLVGIIPGPKEPPLTAINHYLKPVIDEFIEFWDPGIFFSRTVNYPRGRLVYCALILVVCDLLAARKAAGFAACTHEHFCSVCHCTRSQGGYGNTDHGSWRRRTDKELRRSAESYLDAQTAEERLDEFNKTGVRWSELLRLSYFDMSQCVVVDSMHNLFLGLIKEHFKGILGMGLPSMNEKVLSLAFNPAPDTMSENDKKGVERLRAWLEAPFQIAFPTEGEGLKKLTGVNLNSLAFRKAQIEICESHHQSPRKHGHVLEENDMDEIRSDLKKIMTPSWVTSVPVNLGSAAHGKLKADQWRTLGTIHLPLALTRLWSNDWSQHSQDSREGQCHLILLVTAALVSAVILGTSRTITADNAVAYRDYMLTYLEGIKLLFPDYNMRPNHHMAVHIHDYLLLFGPVHSWWTFPFERMIGAVQRMPHNSKIGELEESVARAYTRSANLRALVQKSGCPEVIQHTKDIFRKLSDPEILQGNIMTLSSISSEDPMYANDIPREALQYPAELQQAFKTSGITPPTRGQFLSNITLHERTFSTYSKHQGNSCALVIKSGDLKANPAQIAYIVQSAASGVLETYIAVRRHKPANLPKDPFSSFLVLRAAIWDAEFFDLEIIRPSEISSHFACLPVCLIGRPFAVCLSLCQVSDFSLRSGTCLASNKQTYHSSVSRHASLSLQHIRQLKSQ
ncbi:hypothetical protein CVT26_004612 [Gymnopilus dilepis]|uniref:DUF4218 domain-containing protein n=1 Tax=Gymnopilus dilepis TaxID=231916 RepID=A0A409YJ72_9AGAR|nr:hypothetical protein CVT26_004612 [Gymnopilus dilepis]